MYIILNMMCNIITSSLPSQLSLCLIPTTSTDLPAAYVPCSHSCVFSATSDSGKVVSVKVCKGSGGCQQITASKQKENLLWDAHNQQDWLGSCNISADLALHTERECIKSKVVKKQSDVLECTSTDTNKTWFITETSYNIKIRKIWKTSHNIKMSKYGNA